MTNIDYNFLYKKSGRAETPKYQDVKYRGDSVNISRITDDVFNFMIYIYIKEFENDIESGRYEVYVNIKTFKFVVFHQWCGEDGKDKPRQVKKISKEAKAKVEAYIANKMIGAYFYASSTDDANQEGSNLFPNQEYIDRYEKMNMTCHRTGKKIIKNGEKNSLITDYRGYVWCDFNPNFRSEMDMIAISQIDKEFKVDKMIDFKIISKESENNVNNFGHNVKCFKIFGIIKTKNGKEYKMRFLWYGMSRSMFIYDGDEVKTKLFFNHRDRLSIVYKILPKIIESF